MVTIMSVRDWTCTECDTLNFARREKCFKCTLPQKNRPIDYHASDHNRERGRRHPRERSRSPKDRSSSYLPGDWCCFKCGTHNFSRRLDCFECGQSRDMMLAGDWKCICGMHNFARRTECFKCAQPRRNTSDWKCPDCDFGNREFRSACLRCGTKYPGEVKDLMKNGDWVCNQDGHLNFARRAACQKCGKDKDEQDFVKH